VCVVQKGTELHTAVLDRRGAVAVLCILVGVIRLERVRLSGLYWVGSRLILTIR